MNVKRTLFADTSPSLLLRSSLIEHKTSHILGHVIRSCFSCLEAGDNIALPVVKPGLLFILYKRVLKNIVRQLRLIPGHDFFMMIRTTCIGSISFFLFVATVLMV